MEPSNGGWGPGCRTGAAEGMRAQWPQSRSDLDPQHAGECLLPAVVTASARGRGFLSGAAATASARGRSAVGGRGGGLCQRVALRGTVRTHPASSRHMVATHAPESARYQDLSAHRAARSFRTFTTTARSPSRITCQVLKACAFSSRVGMTPSHQLAQWAPPHWLTVPWAAPGCPTRLLRETQCGARMHVQTA